MHVEDNNVNKEIDTYKKSNSDYDKSSSSSNDNRNWERMPSQEREEIRKQEHLKQLERHIAPASSGLPLDCLEEYAQFLQNQLMLDELEQAVQINDMHKNDYAEQYARNEELLIQKEE